MRSVCAKSVRSRYPQVIQAPHPEYRCSRRPPLVGARSHAAPSGRPLIPLSPRHQAAFRRADGGSRLRWKARNVSESLTKRRFCLALVGRPCQNLARERSVEHYGAVSTGALAPRQRRDGVIRERPSVIYMMSVIMFVSLGGSVVPLVSESPERAKKKRERGF